eukprot:COSAG03_NODE_1883_length_3393_cov_8.997572_4_plen_70_part_00
MAKVTPSGGGPIQQDGTVKPPGHLSYGGKDVSSVVVPAKSAAILLDKAPAHHGAPGGARLKTDDVQVSM